MIETLHLTVDIDFIIIIVYPSIGLTLLLYIPAVTLDMATAQDADTVHFNQKNSKINKCNKTPFLYPHL